MLPKGDSMSISRSWCVRAWIKADSTPLKAEDIFAIQLQIIDWLVVEPTHLKNISQIGNLPQVGVKTRNIWNHHLTNHWKFNQIHSLKLTSCPWGICLPKRKLVFQASIFGCFLPLVSRRVSCKGEWYFSTCHQPFQVPKMEVLTYAVCKAYVRENPTPKIALQGSGNPPF